MRSLLRAFLLIYGTGAALPLLAVLVLLPTTPITFVGFLYLLGGILIVSGMISARWWRRSALLVLLGASLLVVTLTVRLVFPPSGARLTLITLPSHSAPRLWNRIFNEQDVVLFGTRLAPYVGFLSTAENSGLFSALAERYATVQEMTPLSPFLLTYATQQHPDAFDAVVAEPAADTPPTRAIIFLHGYGGNFTLQCWLVAHAGERIGALTVCPSIGPSGDWWNPPGEATLRQTLIYLQQRGIEHVYLAGLSNGGIGASRLAQRFESNLAGLILISGADPAAPITRLPVLVVQGTADERIPQHMIERYVAAAGAACTYVLLEGDHFVLLKHADQVQAAIADWVLQREAHPVK